MSTFKPIKRCYFDLEVSPNLGAFWRCSFKASISPEQILQEREILTASWKFEDEDHIYSMQWNWDAEPEFRDIEIIEQMTEVFERADEVVTQNGKRFDEPWLRTRALMLGLPPLPQVKHVDVLQRHRRFFNFNSNKQDYLTRMFCGEGKPGMKYKQWLDMWYRGCRKSGNEMEEYNRDDVLKLEELDQITRLHEPQTINTKDIETNDGKCPWQGCNGDLYSNGKYNTNTMAYNRYRCNSCNSNFRQSNAGTRRSVK